MYLHCPIHVSRTFSDFLQARRISGVSNQVFKSNEATDIMILSLRLLTKVRNLGTKEFVICASILAHRNDLQVGCHNGLFRDPPQGMSMNDSLTGISTP